MEPDRLLFLGGAWLTHLVIAYALVRGFTRADPRIAIVAGLIPDIDFLFPISWGWPLVHRGLTHTPLFALTLVCGAYVLARDRTVALAVGLAIGSHLAIDALSPAGIDWLFPLVATDGPGVAIHQLPATLLLWGLAIGILLWRTDVQELVRSYVREISIPGHWKERRT